MSTLLNTLRLCFLFSILQFTVTTVAAEDAPPAVLVAAALVHGHVHPRTNNLHIRDCTQQCSSEGLQRVGPCLQKQSAMEIMGCICNTDVSDYPNFWQEFEQCETCVQKETGSQDSGIDFGVQGPELCKSLQGGTDTPSGPAATTENVPEETVIVTETTDVQTTITETSEETITTETTEETPTETADNETTIIETTKELSPTTGITVVNRTTTTTIIEQTPVVSTASRGNTSTTRTGLPTPSQESELPSSSDGTGSNSGAAGSITTVQHGFQAAVWAFGIKLVVVAAFNFIL